MARRAPRSTRPTRCSRSAIACRCRPPSKGSGVPVAIGISGVLILVLNALPFALTATIGVTTIVCAVWTWTGDPPLPRLRASARRRAATSSAPRPDRRPRGDARGRGHRPAAAFEPGRARDAARPRPAHHDVIAGVAQPSSAGWRTIRVPTSGCPRSPGWRRRATNTPDGASRARSAPSVGSTDAAVRLRAAQALEVLDSTDRAAVAALLEDDDMAVRCAALDSVQAGDLIRAGAHPRGAPRCALGRSRRGGGRSARGRRRPVDGASWLDAAGSPATPAVMRLVRAVSTRSAERDQVLSRHVGHPDRELGLIVMERLAAPEPAADATARVLDGVLLEDVRHAGRILGALSAMDASGDDLRETDGPLRRALSRRARLSCPCMSGRAGSPGTDPHDSGP